MAVLYKICSKPLEKGPRNTETEIDLHNNLSSLENVLFSKNIWCKDGWKYEVYFAFKNPTFEKLPFCEVGASHVLTNYKDTKP